MGLGLSTAWNAYSHENGEELLFEIEKMGFSEVELNFSLTSRMVGQIEASPVLKGLKISSLHNYCPTPDELPRKQALPDCFSLSSPQEEERKRAVLYTKRTIDTASRLKAKAVILHCGRVETEDRTRQLIFLHSQGLRDSKEFEQLKASAIKEREENKKMFFESALRSLRELEPYAKERNILLGVENRFYFREVPSLDEIGTILKEFRATNIRYWHDSGHARIMENLGFVRSHLEYLDNYKDSLVGIHLHDVISCQDHLAPSFGELDFGVFKRYLTRDTLKVIEAHQPATADKVIRSREFLERVLL